MSARPSPPNSTARVRRDEPMSQHTSWHVGGPADVFFTPRDRADLAAFLRAAARGHAAPVGGPGQQPAGARRRHPRRGHLHARSASRASSAAAPTRVYCEAGVPCARVTRQCASWGLGHAEFFAGIPGTMGGALAMNAGAFGGETWSYVRAVDVMARDGSCRTRAASEYQVGYRHVRRARQRRVVPGRGTGIQRRRSGGRRRSAARWRSAASSRSRSASGAAARCSPIRPAITPRA